MKKLLLLLFLTFSIGIYSQKYSGTNVRGKVLTYNAYQKNQVPYQSVLVALYTLNKKTNKWKLVSESITNNDGFYFFFNVNPGSYTLQVNGNKNYQINVTKINQRYYQFQDIPILNY